MLASGAHVKIGTHEFTIDESINTAFHKPYHHHFDPLIVQKQGIVGEDGKQQVDPSKLIGGYTDWSGGEGFNNFDKKQPTVYRISESMNVRKTGQLACRPKRTVGTLTSEDISKQPYFAAGDGALWVLQNTRGHFSTDYGATWTTLSEANSGVTGFDAAAFITAADGDPGFAYYAAHEASGTARNIILGHTAAATTSSTLLTAYNSDFPFAELAMFNGRLYAWTGRKLYEIDVFETWPLSFTGDKVRKRFDSGVDPASTHVQGNQWTAGMVNAGSSLCFFYSRQMQGGTIWMFKNGVARPIWDAPNGFMTGSIVYKNGVLFITGHWGVGLVTTGTDTVAQGCGQLFALPLDSLKEINLGTIREFDGDTSGGLLLTKACDSYMGQIMMAGGGTGRLFIYDMAADGVSMLDHLKDAPAGGDGLDFDSNPAERIGDVTTSGPNRLASVFSPNGAGGPSGNVQIITWKDDTAPNRETDGQMATDATTINYLEEGEWDDDYPLSPKSLQGFHVQYMVEGSTTSGLLANQQIKVYYSVDGASYVLAGTVDSSTTPKGPKGLAFLPVSGVTYNRMRVKYTVDNNSTDGVKPPIVYAVLRESGLLDWIESWELAIRLKDEDDETSPVDHRYTGGQLADYLEALFKTRADVTFLDGYRYGENHYDPGAITTHTVKLVSFDHIMEKNGEGYCFITLQAKVATT